MRIVKQMLAGAMAIVLFSGCQKELSFDTNGLSEGSLKSAITGDCLPVTVFGTFKVDSVQTNANYVDVKVDVSIPGTFDVKSDTVNGYSFHKTGNVGSGLNTIRLYPSGKPIAAGIDIFTIKYDSSVCTFAITVTGTGSGAANYTLGGTPNNCTGVTLNGIYMAAFTTSASNTAKVDVTVAGIGAYTLSTDTQNGISFSASGNFTASGAQQVTLTATGTPAAAGAFTYTITGASSTCKFVVTYLAPAPPAVYTLSGDPGICTPATINGTYTAGTVLNSSNNVVVEVNVTTAGTYTLTTDLVNGIKFTASGLFTATGLQNVTLQPTVGSTPLTAGTSTLTPSIGTSMCTFDIIVAAPVDRIYSFKVGTTTYTGPCDGLLTDLGGGSEQLDINGTGADGFTLSLINTAGAVSAGNYSGTSLTGKYASFNFQQGLTFILIGDPNIPVPFNTNLSAVITSINTSTRVVQGTFSGTVRDISLSLVTITNGTFKADY